MNEKARINQLLKTKEICETVIKECKWNLPMIKMTYPEAIITNIQGYPDYKKSKEQAEETLSCIRKVRWKDNGTINKEKE